MKQFTDQLGRTIQLQHPPERIVSVVPSQTELLYDLGLEDEVMGITKFCVHPAKWFKTKTRVGGTKQLNPDKIATLHPDLVIANKEENVQEQIEELEKLCPVWVSNINNLPDALDMISSVGELTGKEKQAALSIQQITTLFSSLEKTDVKPRTCYLVWQKPYMTVGGDTFIHDMMERAGFQNIFSRKTRYPEITIEELHHGFMASWFHC